MTDIVERLRRRGSWVVVKRVPLIPQENETEWRTDPLCAEAADEIERLRAERATRDEVQALPNETIRRLVWEMGGPLPYRITHPAGARFPEEGKNGS